MKQIKINKYISLKLEKGKTIIYVGNKIFRQCKKLFLTQIKGMELLDYQNKAAEVIIDASEMSIDDMEYKYKTTKPIQNINNEKLILDPEEEFWGHLSNLQVWSENDYDSKFLHYSLAFPLLKKLNEIGDPIAKVIFKEEIISRLESGNPIVISYLDLEGYLDNLNDEEFITIMKILDRKLVNIIDNLAKEEIRISEYHREQCNEFKLLHRIKKISKQFLKEIIIQAFKLKKTNAAYYLSEIGYLDFIKGASFISLIKKMDTDFVHLMVELSKLKIVELNLGIYCVLRKVKDYSINFFKILIEKLYKTGDISLILNIKDLYYDKYISREKYYHYILESNEAKILLDLENIFKKKFSLSKEYENEEPCCDITIKNKKVYYLSIIGQNIEFFPRQIIGLTNVKKVCLRGNEIKRIPKSINNLNYLEELDLSDNPIIDYKKNGKKNLILTRSSIS